MNESESTRGRRTDGSDEKRFIPTPDKSSNYTSPSVSQSVLASSVGSAQAGLSVHMVGRGFNLISGERK